MKRRAIVIILAAIVVVIGVWGAFPHIIYAMHADEMPTKWDLNYENLTLHQVYDKIGPPDQDGGVKQFQNWVEKEWWGYKLIKIGAEDFRSDRTDFDVYYSVHVYGHKQQIFFGPPVIKHMVLKQAAASKPD
ncbi:hypothetical protein Q1W73_07880 [Asticcacaulis sp. ZE23SCel15]|uniref:hypothetical protein n=1 Tax=Asticcacaulis sp. ZE23SCel15 TaxID=3059027 RepID=UPI00265FB08D|nr:hypothetical protein [Asticcacaulis sp. ZE23SCel15]WKL58895.1 hypothetical protein Q1W73_07880 [Asticcacaulis sp. ZE23SCel15]